MTSRGKSLFECVNGLRYFGKGAHVTRSIYKFPETYYVLHRVVLSKDQVVDLYLNCHSAGNVFTSIYRIMEWPTGEWCGEGDQRRRSRKLEEFSNGNGASFESRTTQSSRVK